MTVFFAYLGLVAGDSFGAIQSKISTDLLSACKGSWKEWPFVHTVNFRFVPTQHRLLFINGVQILFIVFLRLLERSKRSVEGIGGGEMEGSVMIYSRTASLL